MNWGTYTDRFALAKEPNEPNRFGWVVEIDPFDPASTPKKRTALGRAKREGAAGIISKDGRYAIYSGDDERFDYVYRFVTTARVDTANPRANADILDSGTLSVARFDADGTLTWLPIVFGQGPAHRRKRLQQPGRRADRDPPRRRPARRDEDGSARGRRGQSEDQQGLRGADQQQPPQGRPDRRCKSARRQSLRTHHRDDPAGRRSRRRQVPLGDARPLRRSGDRGSRRDILVGDLAQRLVRHAGQRRRRRTRPALGRDRRQRHGSRPDAPTASGAWKPKGPAAARHGTSIVRRSAPNCAVPALRPTTKRCSSPFSIRASPTTTTRSQRSKIPPPAGRTSSRTCRRGPSIVAITRRGGGKIGV